MVILKSSDAGGLTSVQDYRCQGGLAQPLAMVCISIIVVLKQFCLILKWIQYSNVLHLHFSSMSSRVPLGALFRPECACPFISPTTTSMRCARALMWEHISCYNRRKNDDIGFILVSEFRQLYNTFPLAKGFGSSTRRSHDGTHRLCDSIGWVNSEGRGSMIEMKWRTQSHNITQYSHNIPFLIYKFQTLAACASARAMSVTFWCRKIETRLASKFSLNQRNAQLYGCVRYDERYMDKKFKLGKQTTEIIGTSWASGAQKILEYYYYFCDRSMCNANEVITPSEYSQNICVLGSSESLCGVRRHIFTTLE